MDFHTLVEATTTRNLLRHLTSEEGHGSDINDMIANGASSDLTDQQPLLSPSAEAELLMLATNFLLYVAMVIITIMICKIYFPDSLERKETVPRTFSYVRAPGEKHDISESFYSSDAEDSDDEGSGSGGNDEDGDGDKGTEKTSFEMESSTAVQTGGHQTGFVKGANNFLEFEQSSTSRTDVMKRLVLCVIMLNLAFVTWGVLQERMLTRRYPRLVGEHFTYSYFLVFTSRLWTAVLSGGLMLYLKPRWSSSTVIYEYSFPSISNMLSSWCQYEALQYVSFPAVTLFKSFKLAPVMAMGKFLGNKEYPQYDYMVALIIGIGLTIFMASSDDLHFGYDIHGQTASATWTGIMLLGIFLVFDSFTSQWQSRMFQRHRDLSMIELMFATSTFSTILSFITLVHSKELGPALDFVYRHQEIHVHFFMFSICSTIGQLFIFYTIKNFGAVVFTIIMTTRILISIAISCLIYEHEVSSSGFFGLVMVMGAVCYRINRKAQGTQLIKWEGIGEEKHTDLVQEWHEHVDM